jgi:signal-transduction protein with cAMP-binding, CBS, and nucleotidyltransferase domain
MQLTTVKDWMKDLVVFVNPEATVNEGLALMRHRYMNALIVEKTETNPEYGIVTSIDICDKVVAQQQNPAELKIRDIMASPVRTVPVTMSLPECAGLMKSLRIHHLPVVDEEGKIVGMISATDFLTIAEAMGTNFKERSLR